MSQVSLKALEKSSGAQLQGTTVAAFLNSEDLPKDTHGQKFIITPNIKFDPDISVFNQQDSTSGVKVSFDLKVPFATDQHRPLSAAYVVSDLIFRDRNTGQSIYINEMVFRNGAHLPKDWIFFDPDTNMSVALGIDTPASRFTSPDAKGEQFQCKPWSEWKHFSYSVNVENLHQIVHAMREKYPQKLFSENAADWTLTHWHLNAELLFGDGPAKMGWSMRDLLIEATTGSKEGTPAPINKSTPLR